MRAAMVKILTLVCGLCAAADVSADSDEARIVRPRCRPSRGAARTDPRHFDARRSRPRAYDPARNTATVFRCRSLRSVARLLAARRGSLPDCHHQACRAFPSAALSGRSARLHTCSKPRISTSRRARAVARRLFGRDWTALATQRPGPRTSRMRISARLDRLRCPIPTSFMPQLPPLLRTFATVDKSTWKILAASLAATEARATSTSPGFASPGASRRLQRRAPMRGKAAILAGIAAEPGSRGAPLARHSRIALGCHAVRGFGATETAYLLSFGQHARRTDRHSPCLRPHAAFVTPAAAGDDLPARGRRCGGFTSVTAAAIRCSDARTLDRGHRLRGDQPVRSRLRCFLA